MENDNSNQSKKNIKKETNSTKSKKTSVTKKTKAKKAPKKTTSKKPTTSKKATQRKSSNSTTSKKVTTNKQKSAKKQQPSKEKVVILKEELGDNKMDKNKKDLIEKEKEEEKANLNNNMKTSNTSKKMKKKKKEASKKAETPSEEKLSNEEKLVNSEEPINEENLINNKKINEEILINNEKPINEEKLLNNESQTIETKENLPKSSKKILIKRIIAIVLFVIGLALVIFFTQFGLLKELTIEAGSNRTLSLKDFYKKGLVVYKSEIVSKIEEIDFTKVKNYDIDIKVFGKVKTVKLKVVDTTKPKVVFKDFSSSIDYEPDPNDFIESKEDVSELTVSFVNKPEITDYKDYKVTVSVKDAYGNETKETKNLRISLFKEIVNIELGTPLKKEDILFNLEKGKDYVSQEEIDKINKSGVGDYEIKVTINGIEFKSKISIKDTTPPNLELQNVTIYTDQTNVSQDKFIKSISDQSKYTLTMKSQITYKKVGKQEIKFEAVDAYNNKVEKTATLSIIEDKAGPVFSGLYNLTVNKYSKPNFYSGVSAWDDHDGKVNFSVSGTVNTSKYGNYYITYTAVDKAGNKTTKSRKVTVNHDASDTNAKVTQALAKSGTNYESIRQWIMKNVRYSSGNGSDSVWYGLTNYSGNCIVHAYLYQAMLNKAGYQTKIIYTTDKTHYWVMINLNGKWRHSDATPTSRHNMISAATDSERYAHLQGRNWDRSKWPKAE